MSEDGERSVFDLAKEASDREQRAIIDRATAVLRADSRVLAAWLAGSFARGDADVYSDVDIHCLITDDSSDWFRDHWDQTAGHILPVLMHQSIPGVTGGFVLSPEWQHLDLIFTTVSAFHPDGLTDFVPLFDREGRLPTSSHPTAPTVSLSREQIDLYFYIIGNLVVTLGRGEYLIAHSGLIGVRDAFLIPVMIQTGGSARSGGAKRLNRFLAPEHRRFLEQLPPVSAEPESICTFASLAAREYARLAKPLAARLGIEWPTALEHATAEYLRRHTGIEIL